MKSQILDEKLRAGMSFEDVKDLYPEIGNCRGNIISAQVCQVVIQTRGQTTVNVPLVLNGFGGNTPVAKEEYAEYELFFQANKLQRWTKDSSQLSR